MTFLLEKDLDYPIIEAMKKYGGGFVKTLAELCWHADQENYRKIKKAWPEYFEQYAKMADQEERDKNIKFEI